jgi:hypothetical protein
VAYAMFGAARVFDAGKLRHGIWLGRRWACWC